MRLSHSRQRQNDPLQEVLENRHVGDPRLHEIIKPSDHHVAFQHFGRVAHGGSEVIEDVGSGMIQPHLDEHQRAAPNFRRIEDRSDRGDVALAK